MEDGDLLSVIEQDAALPGSNQKMPGSSRQDRGNGARICGGWQNLAESASVEASNPSLAVAMTSSGSRESAKTPEPARPAGMPGKFVPDRILVKQGSLSRVFLQPSRTRDIEMILKTGALKIDRRGADHFESRVSWSRERLSRQSGTRVPHERRRQRTASPAGCARSPMFPVQPRGQGRSEPPRAPRQNAAS